VLCSELAVLSAIMTVWSMRLPGADEPKHSESMALRDTWDLPVTITALSLASIAFGYGGVTSYAAIYAIERNVHPDSLYFSVFAATIIFVRVTTSHLGDRFGTKPILYPAFAAIPISFAVLAFADTRAEFVISAILFGAGLGSAYPSFANFVLSNTDAARRARTFGSIVWAFDTGIGSGSLLMGLLGEQYSLSRAYLVAAAISLLAIPIFAMASPRLASRGTSVA
jgi:MFS family permease